MWQCPENHICVFESKPSFNQINVEAQCMPPFYMSDSYQGVANIRIFKYIRIFSDTNIRSYHIRIIFLYKYIWIFVRMAQVVHAMFDILSLLLCQLCFNILLYHTSKIQHLKSNLKPNIKNLIRMYL